MLLSLLQRVQTLKSSILSIIDNRDKDRQKSRSQLEIQCDLNKKEEEKLKIEIQSLNDQNEKQTQLIQNLNQQIFEWKSKAEDSQTEIRKMVEKINEDWKSNFKELSLLQK